jgi:RHS repeat-associated protein
MRRTIDEGVYQRGRSIGDAEVTVAFRARPAVRLPGGGTRMKAWRWLLGGTVFALGVGATYAQTPVLSNIEAPYAALQSSVKIGGVTYGPGSVAYGPAGTPLVLTGSALGGSGTVQFIPYKSGVVDTSVTPAQATVTMWTSNMLILTVPAGAYSGLVTVTAEDKTSNGVPFMVTPGAYAGTCPGGPSSTQLQITTASLHDGAVGQAYSATLGATGGTTAYSWSITSGTLPSGLTLNASTGTISGTPTAASGSADFTFEVTDSSAPKQTNEAVLSLNIEPQTLTAATVYNYTANSYDGVGNLTNYTDSVMGTWGLTYDYLNRLISGTPSAGDFSGNNYYCWSYDAFGNRTSQVLQTAACPTLPASPAATISYSGTNQVTWIQNVAPTGLAYDAAGDALSAVTSVGQTYYSYDAEGRICAEQSTPMPGMAAAYGYLYDANGTRVAKGSITASPNPLTQPLSCDPTTNGFQFTENYVLGPGGEELTMFSVANGTSTWQRTNVYVGSKLLGTYDVAGLHFHLTDPLGTRRMQLSGNFTCLGQPETDVQSLPFGDQLNSYPDQYACATADDATPLYFTDHERDTESGNDYFGARYYSSAMGRFMSPDPLMATPERLLDPQEWNMYSYGRNNPLSFSDPTGLDIWLQGCGKDNGSTCKGNFVGTTDSDGNFSRTHLTGDQTGDATLGTNGISVTQGGNTYQGVWDSNAGEQGAVQIAGGGDLSSFNANITGNCQGTCVASGSITNKDGSAAAAGDVRAALTNPDGSAKSGWFANNNDPFHRSSNGNGKNVNDTSFNAMNPDVAGQRSTDVTVPQNPGLGVRMHVNSGYPFEDAYQMTRHVISIMHTFTNVVGITHPTTQ